MSLFYLRINLNNTYPKLSQIIFMLLSTLEVHFPILIVPFNLLILQRNSNLTPGTTLPLNLALFIPVKIGVYLLM